MNVSDRFLLTFDESRHRRTIGGTEVVLHCHHYNARVQRTVEASQCIDGKAIWVSSSEGVFSKMLGALLRADDGPETRRAVVEGLYAHLGYGRLDLSHVDEGYVLAPHSHFVEGWLACLSTPKGPVCSLTTGYLQAAIHALTGELVSLDEKECMAQGASACRFEITRGRTVPIYAYERTPTTEGVALEHVATSQVDEQRIVRSVAAMPLVGGSEGLIPAFNVYLASTPADLYNLVCIRFLDEMRAAGLAGAARAQLIHDAENCGLNTFRGIMASPEWQSLVEPMVKDTRDRLFGVVAVTNALGWGRWCVLEHTAPGSMVIASNDGYEADGYLGLRGPSSNPSCLMLTGVAAGVMALIYGHGALCDRPGQYRSTEEYCRCAQAGSCSFVVEEAA